MRKGGRGAGFSTEPGRQIQRAGESLSNHFQRDPALEQAVHREIDGPHPATAETTLEPVAIVDHERPGHSGQGSSIVSADHSRTVKTGAAMLALRKAALVGHRPLEEHANRIGDGRQQVHVLLVVGLLGPARTQGEQAERELAAGVR